MACSSGLAAIPVTAGGGGALTSSSSSRHMQAWWEGIAKARDRIQALLQILGHQDALQALLDSERPAKGLLEEKCVAEIILAHLADPSSGHAQDPLCQWLYDTFLNGDPDLQAVVLRYIPALCGLYLARATSCGDKSLAGFEAVLLALYTSEVKARNGRPLVINIPDLAQPSLYHAPRIAATSPDPRLGVLAAPLEPQYAVKATKRTCIVGVALDLFCRRIAIMPCKAKIEACQCAVRWGRLSCVGDEDVSVHGTYCSLGTAATQASCNGTMVVDQNPCVGMPSLPSSQQVPEIEIVGPEELFLGSKSPSHHTSGHHQLSSPKQSPSVTNAIEKLPPDNQLVPSLKNALANDTFGRSLTEAGNGARVQLPWELLQPLIRILGHCLLAPLSPQELKDSALAASKVLHVRASHDSIPEAILATRSLLQLDTAARAALRNMATLVNTVPTSPKPRKPEIFLVSK